MENKKIVMGSDHAGLQLKLKVKAHLEARGFEVTDVGTNTPESCNYTVYADALCKTLTAGDADLVDLFVDTPFEGGRHQARVDDLNALDANK